MAVYDPWHYVPVLARKPSVPCAQRRPSKDWVLCRPRSNVYPAQARQCRRWQSSDGRHPQRGSDRRLAGRQEAESLRAEAIAHGVHSADVVLNILARQRDPAPQANILTPAALTLRHAPIADCARYDNLRRTI